MNNMRIMYLRDSSDRPVGCLAIRLIRSRGVAEYNYSVQNPVDNFERAMGRQLAIGRMVEAPLSVRISKNVDMHQVSLAVMTDLSSTKGAPTRAVKAAQQWLKNNAAQSLINAASEQD
jgi:hypothetical protein